MSNFHQPKPVMQPVKFQMTPREAAEVHLAAELVVETFKTTKPERVTPQLVRGLNALEAGLVKAGYSRTEGGDWVFATQGRRR